MGPKHVHSPSWLPHVGSLPETRADRVLLASLAHHQRCSCRTPNYAAAPPKFQPFNKQAPVSGTNAAIALSALLTSTPGEPLRNTLDTYGWESKTSVAQSTRDLVISEEAT